MGVVQRKKNLLKTIIILLIIPYSKGQQHSPRLHPMQAEHVLDPNAEFRLKCSGSKPVEWALPLDDPPPPAGEALPLAQRIEMDDEVIEGVVERPYVIHLTIANLHYLDTGVYICRYQVCTDRLLDNYYSLMKCFRTTMTPILLIRQALTST